MASFNFARESKRTRVSNAVAAGTTDVNTTVLDMSGFDCVYWEALFGTLTATQVTLIKAQQGDLADGSDAADITGAATAALADADSNKALVLEVIRPQKRFVRLVVDRGTANAVIDGVMGIQYHSMKQPEADDSTVKEKKSVVPTT